MALQELWEKLGRMDCGRLGTAHSLKIRTLFGHSNIYTVLYLPMLPAYARCLCCVFKIFEILSSMYYFQPNSAKIGVILMCIQRYEFFR